MGGFNVVSETDRLREIINLVSGEESSGYGLLTVRENVWLFSQLYGIPGKIANARIQDLLHVMGLEPRADAKVHQISTGERQRTNLCRGSCYRPSNSIPGRTYSWTGR